jgi:vacuolar-type H+-ATPase subunit I/STV1
MRKFRDPKTGAIRFEMTSEDIEKKKLYDKIKDLEKRIIQLENSLKEINNIKTTEETITKRKKKASSEEVK